MRGYIHVGIHRNVLKRNRKIYKQPERNIEFIPSLSIKYL